MQVTRLLFALVGATVLVPSAATPDAEAKVNATRSLRSEASRVCFRGFPSHDLPGNDIGSLDNLNLPEQCRAQCASRSDCYAYTYVWNDRKCYLKSTPRSNAARSVFNVEHAMTTYKQGLISGVKLPARCPEYAFVTANCDYPGQDVKSIPGSNFESCFWELTAYRAFTWSDYNGGTCWMKSGWDTCEPGNNMYSALRLPTQDF